MHTPLQVFIDTNVWIGLLSDTNDQSLFNFLENAIEQETMELLVPGILVKEWNKHSMDTLKKMAEAFTTAKYFGNNILDPRLDNDLVSARNKKEKIDEMFANGTQLSISNSVKITAGDRFENGQAPFHHKEKSTADAMLFFSCIEYVQKKKINELIFVTKNTSDFAMPGNNQELHRDLLVPGVKVRFYPALGKYLKELSGDLKIDFSKKQDGANQQYIINLVKPNENMLEYLYEVALAARKLLQFLPISILYRIAPFRVRDKQHLQSHYINFSVYTNNKKLIDFFKLTEIGKISKFKKNAVYKNTASNLKKLRFIIQVLNENLVFAITHATLGEKVDIIIPVEPKRYPIVLCFENLDWPAAILQLNLHSGEIEEKMSKAFIAYAMGFYSEALKIYYQIYESAQIDKNHFLSYRTSFCLQWVSKLAIIDQKADAKISEEIKRIDVERDYFLFANAPELEKELASEFLLSNLLLHYGNEIKNSVAEIRDHYENQLKGGYSSNSNYSNLRNIFAQYHFFIEKNGLPFIKFTNFIEIAALYFEGVFLSCALNRYQSSRVEYIDEYLLELMIAYAKPEQLVKLYNRYIKKPIPFRESTRKRKAKDVMLVFMENFIAGLDSISQFNPDAFYAREIYFNMAWNIFTILAIIDFDKNFIKKFEDPLYTFLNAVPEAKKYNLKFAASFITVKAVCFSHSFVKKLYTLCLTKPALHNYELLTAFAVIYKEKPPLVTTNLQFEFIEKYFLEKCEKCKQVHVNIIPESFTLFSMQYRKKIKNTVTRKLKTKFDMDLYYSSALHEVIEYEIFIEEYLVHFQRPSVGSESRNVFTGGEITMRRVNELMNLLFKNNYPLPESIRDELKGFSPYYDWLTNMDDFDYRKFDPLWTIQYVTRFYMERIFSIKKVRQAVKEYLRNNDQPYISNLFAIHG